MALETGIQSGGGKRRRTEFPFALVPEPGVFEKPGVSLLHVLGNDYLYLVPGFNGYRYLLNVLLHPIGGTGVLVD